MNFYVHSIEYKDLLKNTQKQCFHENKIAVLYMLNLKVISIVKIKKTTVVSPSKTKEFLKSSCFLR